MPNEFLKWKIYLVIRCLFICIVMCNFFAFEQKTETGRYWNIWKNRKDASEAGMGHQPVTPSQTGNRGGGYGASASNPIPNR